MKYNFINDDIKIDFEVPRTLKNTFAEAEELDLAHDYIYFLVADTIDVCAKEAYVNHLITKEQWDTICSRYPAT